MLSDAVSYGLGEHIDRVTTSGWRRIGIEIAVSRGLAIVIPWLVRVSFSFTLFLVIRGTRHDKLRWLIWSNVVVETVVSLIGIIIIYSHCGHDSSRYARGFVCRPTEKVDYYSYIHSGMQHRDAVIRLHSRHHRYQLLVEYCSCWGPILVNS